MINRWSDLNLGGRVLFVACLINLWIAIVLAHAGSWSCIFSAFMAAFCGLSSYNSKYKITRSEDINDRSE